MNKLVARQRLVMTFTFFSMFFGAGNLIFPPFVGAQAGSATIAKIGPDGDFQEPTEEGAAAAVEASPLEEGRADNDIAITIDRSAAGYPLVLVSYAIACAEYKDTAQGALVKDYLSYIASEEGQSAAEASAGSAPLSASLREKVLAAIDTIK